jgi:hypothetical protein
MKTLGVPECSPLIILDKLDQADSLPKYLVSPGSLLERVKRGLKREDMRIKIIDFGAGSSL